MRIFIFCLTIIFTGCATSVYRNWGDQLANAPSTNPTKGDISLMLGTEPYKCEDISANPMIGLLLKDEYGVTVAGIDPNGSSVNKGIITGDKIISINSKTVKSSQEAVATIRSEGTSGRIITINTQRGSYAITPKYPAGVEQCYWEIIAGQISKMSGAAYIDQRNGSAFKSGTSYQRFFRATCRFSDGRVDTCQSNWQE